MNNHPGLRLGGVPEHFNLPWHLALEAAEQHDVPATWEDQPGGTGEMLDKLAAGELDVVSILTEGTVTAIDRGARLTIVQVYVESALQWGVHVPAASTFTNEAQLEGHRIAISRFGSGSHLMAYVQAQRNGWQLSDEQWVVVGGLDGAREAFADGDADLFLWDQFMTQPLVDSGELRRLAIQETPWPSFVIAARTDVLLERTAEVGLLIDAIVSQATRLVSRPGIIGELSDRYGLSRPAAKGWLESTRFAVRSAFEPDVHERVATLLRQAGFS